jgi:hypothetical protein
MESMVAGSRIILRTVGAALACVTLIVQSSVAQDAPRSQRVDIPAGATSLEGVPTVRIDSSEQQTTRRVLNPEEAATARLTINVIGGQLYWATRDNRLLRVNSSGEFTYLTSDPGQYIRLTLLDDRISYAEHVDLTSGSVTWFGELRIIVDK